jgi:hypothetical protein
MSTREHGTDVPILCSCACICMLPIFFPIKRVFLHTRTRVVENMLVCRRLFFQPTDAAGSRHHVNVAETGCEAISPSNEGSTPPFGLVAVAKFQGEIYATLTSTSWNLHVSFLPSLGPPRTRDLDACQCPFSFESSEAQT